MNSLLLCIPFAGLLLCIAVMPLVKPEWWEKHQALAVKMCIRDRGEEEKENLSISKVAASEMERGQTGVRALRGSDRI